MSPYFCPSQVRVATWQGQDVQLILPQVMADSGPLSSPTPRDELLPRLLWAAIQGYGRPGDTDFDDEEAHLADLAGRSELTPEEFEWIVEWKQERGFGKHVRGQNTEDAIREATRRAFASRDVATAIDSLVSAGGEGLKGVRYPTASAILTFHDPERFTIIDPSAWKALYVILNTLDPTIPIQDREPDHDSGPSYAIYVSLCQTLAQLHHLTLRDLDRGLYVLGRDPWVFGLLSEHGE
jgi:hypothetical protein